MATKKKKKTNKNQQVANSKNSRVVANSTATRKKTTTKKTRQSSAYSTPVSEYRKRTNTTAKKNTTTQKKTTTAQKSTAPKTAQKQVSTSKNSRVQDVAPYKKRQTSEYSAVNNRAVSAKKLTPTTTTSRVNNVVTNSKNSRVQDIAPVKQKKEDDGRTWFKRSEVFDDGYQVGDITKAILGSGTDLIKEAGTGVIGMGEKALDAFAMMSPGMYTANQVRMDMTPPDMELYKEMQTEMDKFVKKDLYDEEKVARNILEGVGVNVQKQEANSVFGEKSDALAQSAGQLGATALLQTVGVPWFLTTGATTFGSEAENALKEGATHEEAMYSSLISSGAEILSEKISGGISFGGKTMDDALLDPLVRRISSKTARTLTKLGADAGGEGFEEVFSSAMSRLGSKLYKEESIGELLTSEEAMDEYLESFIGGAFLGGGSNAINSVKSNKAGKDYATGLSENELKVVQKEIESRIAEKESDGTKLKTKDKNKISDEVYRDLEKGYISIDTIESTLGGETYKKYKDSVDNETKLQQEYDKLHKMQRGNMTGEQLDRETELKNQLDELKKNSNTSQMREQLDSEMSGLIANDKLLQESYNERSRRGQTFEADLSKYDAKQQEVIKKATESGILNNTNRTHEFVDMVAKISADKGVSFDFTNNQRLRESGFAMKGKIINGYEDNGNIVLNIESKKALNSLVGHEVTHVLEGTDVYTELQSIVKEYATKKGDYQARYDAFTELYKNVKNANIEKEVTADLVGDYIFADTDFISRLSAEKPNVFKKIYDEIKYLVKSVTGTKEARELEKLKRTFEKAYRETAKANVSGETKYSYSSIANSFFGDPNMTTEDFTKTDEDGVPLYKKSEGYTRYVEQCMSNMRQSRADFNETLARESIEKQIDGIIEVAKASKQAGYDIMDYVESKDGERKSVIDLKDSKDRLLFSSLEPNSEYTTSSDISTICDKRKNFAEIYDDIVRAEESRGVPKGKRFFDNVDNYFYIHKVMADKGLTQPCRQCYVESMRKNLAPMSTAFMELISETNPENKANKQLYNQSGKNKGKLKTGNAEMRTKVLERLTEYGMTPEDLSIEMLSTSDGLAQLKIQAPLVYEAFNSFYGQSKPKMPKQATPFRFGELTALLTDSNGKIKKSVVDKINSTGGFRLQSYSDFQIQNYTDVLQVLFEAGTLGLNGHAYTKVPAFLDATEGTNLKRNISIFMYKDGNQWKIDKNDSFPYELQEIYDIVDADKSGNTGIIAVSQNDEMSAWIMANDHVGYGIPFHKSGLKMGTVRNTDVRTDDGRIVKGYKGIKDHTRQQTEVWKSTAKNEAGEIVHKANTKVKKGINIYEFWDFNNAEGLSKTKLIEKNVKRYIDECNKAGYLPKFRDYVMNNGKVLNDVLMYSKELGTVPQDATIEDISFKHGEYRIPYGYYKFLGDFGMFAPDGSASGQNTLSLENYAFDKAVEFFQDSKTLRRNELLQQFANGEERAKYRDSNLSNEDLEKIVKEKRQSVVDEIIAPVKGETKYSLTEDSDGNQLSKEQQERFKESKVRDEEGRLKPLYHGSESMAFTEFNAENGVWLSETQSYAEVYAGNWHSWRDDFDDAPIRSDINGLEKEVYTDEDLRVYKLYADIRNPFNIGEINGTLSDGKVSELANALGHLVADKTGNMKDGGRVARELRSIARDYIGEKAYNFTRTKGFIDFVKKQGFDGLEATENGKKTYCAFNPADQLKLTSNQTPTSNPDIRYSLTENAEQIDNDYRKAVDSGDMETAQKMVDEVAKANGYDTVVFHGTNTDKINVFIGSPDRMETNAPNLIKGYFSDQEAYAGDYGENTFKYYVNSDDFLDIEPMYDADEMTEYLEKHGVTGVEYNDFISNEDEVASWLDDYGDVIDPWMFFNENGGNITERIREAGYKGVCWSEGYFTEDGGTAYMPFESNLIKSADAVTHDDNGKVIPLSERFKKSNDDVRYSMSEDNSFQDDYAPLTEAEANERDAMFSEVWNPMDSDAPTDIAPINNTVDSNRIEEDIAPFKADDSEDVDDAVPRKGERLSRADARKIENIKSYIKGSQVTRETGIKEYDEKIARKQAEYDALKDKTTKKATNLYQQIQNIEAKKTNWLESIDKKIENYHKAIENIEAKSRRDRRVSKNQEYRELFSDLIGDTSTWKDKKIGIYYQTNTLRRNLRDIVRDATGKRDIARADAIYEELQGKYNRHEADLNREANAIKKDYRDMKITKAEDNFIQMLGEFRHNPSTTITQEQVDKFYEKHKNKIDMDKVNKAIDMSRKLYDSLYERVNKVLVEHGFKEIEYRKGYFPHFTETKQNLLQKIFNWKTTDETIPTDIAGLTEEFNPNRSWQSFDKRRHSDATDYSFTKGLDNYIRGSLDWIYHIEDIQKRRALETEIRYRHSDKGLQEQIDAIRSNESLTNEEVDELIQNKLKEARNPLGNFLIDLRNGTNNLAGKKSTADRSLEYATNRQIYSTMTNISSRVSANAVVGSVSSAMTNFIPITQSWGQVSPMASIVAMRDTIKSTIKDDGMINKSTFLTNRLRQNEALYKSAWDKVGDKAGAMMEIVDNFTSQTVWRSKYMENIKNGMSENEAIMDADQFAENVIAGRSRGNMPTIFNSKNPITKMFTAFQLEVANQYGYMFKDMPQDVAKEGIGKLVKGYATMFVGAYVYNALTSTLTGRDSAFDPGGIILDFLKDLFGDDDEEPKDPLTAVKGLSKDVVEEIPFVGGLMGGGRIPISSAIPYDDPLAMVTGTVDDIAEKDWENLANEWSNPLYYLAMPMGGGQIRKTIQGLGMFSDEHPISGSYTNSGNLRYPVEDTFLNKLQAGIFGQYANKNARDYFDNGRQALKEEQIEEFIDLDIPIREYWDYREGLKEQETLEDKFEYIADLDLPVSKKNILINNIVDREEEVDMSNYDDFSNYEEFDFATKNPEKWDFFQEYGISYDEYRESKENEDTARMYDWAYQNPDYFQVARAISSDLETYWKHNGYMWNNIRADKDENGNSIPGTKKDKIIDYINSIDDMEYEEKLVLFKKYYPKDDTYNSEIIDYLNSREDISYDEMKTILEELEFKVDSKGNISW